MSSADLLAKKLAVTFRQVGIGDSSKPIIVSLQMLTRTVNTNSSSAIINFSVRAKDVGSGLNGIAGSFSGRRGGRGSFSVSMANPEAILSCNGTVAPDPGTGQTSSSCLSSGTVFDATLNIKVRLRQNSPKGIYRLDYLSADDNAQNRTEILNKNPWNRIGFTQIGSGDSKSPKISQISVLTPTVNTSMTSQVVKIRVKFSENGSGVGKLEIMFSPLNRLNYIWFSFDAKNLKCNQNDDIAQLGGACLVSGTPQNGVIELTSWLPSHAPKTDFYVQQVSIQDQAGNGGGCMRDSCQEVAEIGFSVRKIKISNVG
jgi:hypothetical protein